MIDWLASRETGVHASLNRISDVPVAVRMFPGYRQPDFVTRIATSARGHSNVEVMSQSGPSSNDGIRCAFRYADGPDSSVKPWHGARPSPMRYFDRCSDFDSTSPRSGLTSQIARIATCSTEVLVVMSVGSSSVGSL